MYRQKDLIAMTAKDPPAAVAQFIKVGIWGWHFRLWIIRSRGMIGVISGRGRLGGSMLALRKDERRRKDELVGGSGNG